MPMIDVYAAAGALPDPWACSRPGGSSDALGAGARPASGPIVDEPDSLRALKEETIK